MSDLSHKLDIALGLNEAAVDEPGSFRDNESRRDRIKRYTEQIAALNQQKAEREDQINDLDIEENTTRQSLERERIYLTQQVREYSSDITRGIRTAEEINSEIGAAKNRTEAASQVAERRGFRGNFATHVVRAVHSVGRKNQREAELRQIDHLRERMQEQIGQIDGRIENVQMRLDDISGMLF